MKSLAMARVLPYACNHLRYLSMSPSFAKLFGTLIPNAHSKLYAKAFEKSSSDAPVKKEQPSGPETKPSKHDKDTSNTKKEHTLPLEMERVCAAMNNRED